MIEKEGLPMVCLAIKNKETELGWRIARVGKPDVPMVIDVLPNYERLYRADLPAKLKEEITVLMAHLPEFLLEKITALRWQRLTRVVVNGMGRLTPITKGMVDGKLLKKRTSALSRNAGVDQGPVLICTGLFFNSKGQPLAVDCVEY